MSATKLNDILKQIQTQLKEIQGGSDYDLTVQSNRVVIGFVPLDKATGYPFISIGYIGQEDDYQTDQITVEVPVTVEIFGYVRSIEPLWEANKLIDDIKTAIRENESLGSIRCWGMKMRSESSSYNDHGICRVTLKFFVEDE